MKSNVVDGCGIFTSTLFLKTSDFGGLAGDISSNLATSASSSWRLHKSQNELTAGGSQDL